MLVVASSAVESSIGSHFRLSTEDPIVHPLEMPLGTSMGSTFEANGAAHTPAKLFDTLTFLPSFWPNKTPTTRFFVPFAERP
jgi:hypothetical protein